MANLIKQWLLRKIHFINKLRWLIYTEYNQTKRENFRQIGKNCSISPGCLISHRRRVTIKNNVLIQSKSVIHSLGGLYIGNNVGIAVGCTIWTADHVYRDGVAIPHSPKDLAKPVYIHDNVWIGANVSILPGVEIHEGAIIGMGSVVINQVPYCAIVLGNPARVIGYRDKNLYEQCKKEGRFTNFSSRDKIIVPKFIQRRPNLFNLVKPFVDNKEMFLEE